MRFSMLTIAGVATVLLHISANADEPRELDSIVVTAARTPIPLWHSGSAITIIDRDEIERRQVVFVADLLRDVPGFAVSRAGPVGAQTQVRVRGAEANHVLVLIDGVEVNDPSAGDEFSFEHLPVHDITRIEIVRGPQSALWGSDAIAGVINIITRNGVEAEPLTVNANLGSFGTLDASAGYGYSTDKWRIRLGASHFDTDGTNVSRTGGEDDGYLNTQATLYAAWMPVDSLRLDLGLRHTDSRAQFDRADFLTTGLPADSDNELDSTLSYLRAGAEIDAPANWRHRIGLSWAGSDRDSRDAGLATAQTAADRYQVSLQSSVQLPEAASRRSPRRLTFAVDHERQDYRQRGAAGFFGDPNQQQSWSNTGWVVEYIANPLQRLTATVAVRYDRNSDFDDATTYRTSIGYTFPSSGTRLRAAWGTGHKAPTFVERYGFFADTFIGNSLLKPEESRGWEVGILKTLADGRTSIDIAWFQDRLRNEIDGFVFDPASFAFTAANRSGTSRRRGLESALRWQVSGGVAARATWTWLDADEPDGLGGNRTELRRPRNTGSLNLDYTGVEERLRANVNLSWNGVRNDLLFPPFPEPARTVRLDDYALVTLAAAYELTNRLTVHGRVENLLNEDYEDIVGFASPGIGVYLGIRVRIGGRTPSGGT